MTKMHDYGNGSIDIGNPRQVAENMANLSVYIREGFCKGMVMIALPFYKHMNHLSKRLYDYGGAVAGTAVPRFIPFPEQATTLDLATAINTMKQLIIFLRQSSNRLQRSGLTDANEQALAKDLETAVRYSSRLLGLTPISIQDIEESSAVEHVFDRAASSHVSEDLGTVFPSQDLANADQDHVWQQSQEVAPEGRLHFTFNLEEPASPVTPTSQNLLGELLGQTLTTESAAAEMQSLLSIREAANASPASSGASTPAGSHTPADLRPMPHELEHAPHVLQGLRLKSRRGVMGTHAFIKSFMHDDIVLSEVGNPHTNVQLGHSHTAGDMSHSSVVVDARRLEWPGVETIRLVLPLCAKEVRLLDYDVVRYIDLAVDHKLAAVMRGAEGTDPRQARKFARILRKACAITKREIACRHYAIDQGVGDDIDEPDVESQLSERSIPAGLSRADYSPEHWALLPRRHLPRPDVTVMHAFIEPGFAPIEASAATKSQDLKVESPYPRPAAAEGEISPLSLSPMINPQNASKTKSCAPENSRILPQTSPPPQPQPSKKASSNASSEIVPPAPALPLRSHHSAERVAIPHGSERTAQKNSNYHPIRVRPGRHIQRGSSAGRISPLHDAASANAANAEEERVAAANASNRTHTWVNETPPLPHSPHNQSRQKGDWTTLNQSIHSETSWDHDDWIEMALRTNKNPAPPPPPVVKQNHDDDVSRTGGGVGGLENGFSSKELCSKEKDSRGSSSHAHPHSGNSSGHARRHLVGQRDRTATAEELGKDEVLASSASPSLSPSLRSSRGRERIGNGTTEFERR